MAHERLGKKVDAVSVISRMLDDAPVVFEILAELTHHIAPARIAVALGGAVDSGARDAEFLGNKAYGRFLARAQVVAHRLVDGAIGCLDI